MRWTPLRPRCLLLHLRPRPSGLTHHGQSTDRPLLLWRSRRPRCLASNRLISDITFQDMCAACFTLCLRQPRPAGPASTLWLVRNPCRVHIRQEIVSSEYELDAAEAVLPGIPSTSGPCTEAPIVGHTRRGCGPTVCQAYGGVPAEMRAVPGSEVQNAGSQLLRKVNFLDFKQAM